MATPRSRSRPPPAPTWVGGSVQSANYAFDPEPYRPELVLWVHGDEVLASEIVHPSKRVEALARCLRVALSKAPHPVSVRVNDAAFLSSVRAALDGVPARVGKTPELNVAGEALLPPMAASDEDSYLSGGRIDAGLVGAFFSAAAPLFRAAPWSVVPDDTVLFAFDAPALGVHDAAVIVVGQRGVARGVLMFQGFDEYMAFQRAAMAEDDREDHGAELFAISFADTLSEQRAAEVAAHRWELAAPGVLAVGVPVLERFDRDGLQRPLVARDMLVATALCRVVTEMIARHPKRLAASHGPSVAAHFPAQQRGNAAVSTLTLPHPAAESFDAAMAPHREVSVLLRDFLASDVRGRVPGIWREVAEVVAHALLEEKFERSGPRLDRWPLRSVDEAVARVAPNIEGPRVHKIALDVLARFFAWLGAEGRVPEALADRLLERAKGRFEAHASDAVDDSPSEQDGFEEGVSEGFDDGTVDGEVLPPGVAEWARGAIRDARR